MNTEPTTTLAAAKAASEADTLEIKAALAAASGNVSVAAKSLDVSRRTLHRWITNLGLRAWLSDTYPRSVRRIPPGAATEDRSEKHRHRVFR